MVFFELVSGFVSVIVGVVSRVGGSKFKKRVKPPELDRWLRPKLFWIRIFEKLIRKSFEFQKINYLGLVAEKKVIRPDDLKNFGYDLIIRIISDL